MVEMQTTATRVLDALVVAGALTTDQLVAARADADGGGASAGQVLLERGVISEADVDRVLNEDLGIPSVDLASYAPDEAALRLVSPDLAREHEVVPLFEIEGTLTVAIGSPGDVFGLDKIAAATGLEVEAVRTTVASVHDALAQCYPAGAAGEPEGADVAVMAYTEFPEELEWEGPPPGGGEPFPTPTSEAVAEPELLLEAGRASIDLHGEQVSEAEGPVADEESVLGEEPALGEAPVSEEPTREEEPGALDEGGESSVAGRGSEPELVQGPQAEAASAEEVESLQPSPEELLEELLSHETEVERAVSEHPPVEVPVAPTIDLDVLAVADAGRVAVLVGDLLELAVRREASHIHVLPYKEEFFVALRVSGRLEQVGHAPRSLEGSLVEGFKAYVRMSGGAGELPAVGRTQADVAGRRVTFTASTVPTIAGHRLVVTLSPQSLAPLAFDKLGLAGPEAQALEALVERGRGLLVVASPVGGGMSTTCAALMARAAGAGRTTYSVEREFGYEIPSVAQVVVGPASAANPAAYLAAGLEQDTDVIAFDEARTAEEVELAIKGAASGKLAIISVRASGAPAAVRRVLDLGVEPESLASMLALVVAQRLVGSVCQECVELKPSALAALIPGAEAHMVSPVGQGCAVCGGTGVTGMTGLFEVLPVQEDVRRAIARSDSLEDLAQKAEAVGMRPMLTAGLAKLRDGLVSAEELDRVLRYSG